jgi:hypothetical protein
VAFEGGSCPSFFDFPMTILNFSFLLQSYGISDDERVSLFSSAVFLPIPCAKESSFSEMKPVPDDLDCKQRNIGEISKPEQIKTNFIMALEN